MVLGLLIGKITVPVGEFSVGLGNAGGLLLSGILVSSLVSRLRFFGSTPNAARNILEDLGLVTFIAIVGINAGATLLEQLTGAIAVKIFLAGFVASTIPPFITWAIGLYIFKINPAVLMGGVAGSRSHSGPAREAAKETGTQRAVGRIPGRLCRFRRALHGVRLLRDAAVAIERQRKRRMLLQSSTRHCCSRGISLAKWMDDAHVRSTPLRQPLRDRLRRALPAPPCAGPV